MMAIDDDVYCEYSRTVRGSMDLKTEKMSSNCDVPRYFQLWCRCERVELK